MVAAETCAIAREGGLATRRARSSRQWRMHVSFVEIAAILTSSIRPQAIDRRHHPGLHLHRRVPQRARDQVMHTRLISALPEKRGNLRPVADLMCDRLQNELSRCDRSRTRT